ncbi:hypothetical protein H6G76_26950 [Nostoc sp. FACHB-152]|uniref:hypothetical protein n=1 Tax=unclassified Nostoc TaxID=2593658 RepID=UPI0016849F5A|nr:MULTISPECIES: hypothetical protein [unclassified Nostoc]MBD2450702.1 hypothetical protein [Nostoc sp. FACHB-152]MBD2471914.1 hypothetical protein [Nostoc sp. FACHB-145]
MEFLKPQEAARLQRILTNTLRLETADERRNYLTICGLEEYRGRIQFDKTLENFVISVLATLSKGYIVRDSARVLSLVVFLEYTLESYENSLSPQELEFIQQVINKCQDREESKRQSASRSPQQPTKPISSQSQNKSPNIQQPTNITPRTTAPVNNKSTSTPPVNSKSQSASPAVTTRPTSTGRPSPTRPPTFTVNSAVDVGKKIWFILLPIVILWFFVGAANKSFLDASNNAQSLNTLIICGSVGGLASGLGGWIAWWRVALARRPIHWEQALMSSIIGLIGGAITWAGVGNVLSNGGIFSDHTPTIGLFFGLIVVTGIFGWLSFKLSRT